MHYAPSLPSQMCSKTAEYKIYPCTYSPVRPTVGWLGAGGFPSLCLLSVLMFQHCANSVYKKDQLIYRMVQEWFTIASKKQGNL